MASAQARKLDELEQRLRRLERSQSQMESDLLEALAKALAQVIKDYGCMTFKGTYDEDLQYAKGSIVVHNGATWVAIAPTVKGGKPGRAPEWKLTAKGEGR